MAGVLSPLRFAPFGSEPCATSHTAKNVPQRRSRTPPGPVPTLGELQHGTPWIWAYCEGLDTIGRPCMHRTPLALAPFVIRWGAEASSDVMRKRLRGAVPRPAKRLPSSLV